MANLTLDEYTAAQRKIYDAYAADEIKKKQAAVDTSVAAVKAQGEKDIESTNASYEDVFRKNNLNQIINEEQTKERMANLGLTDSGLNRSQQTAIQLQRSNADAATIRNRQAAVDEIRKGIAEYVTAAEAQKAEIDSTVRSNWMQKADANAVALYNQQEANNAAIEAAKHENWINPDDIEVDENGNVTANGKALFTPSQPDASAPKAYSGVQGITGFEPDRWADDNFKIKINGKNYTVEERGKVSETNTLNALNSVNAGNNDLINYNGNLYLKQTKRSAGGVVTSSYYLIGGTNILGIKRQQLDKLKKALGITNETV